MTENEKKLIVETLLFTACVDVCYKTSDTKHNMKLVQLAEKLNKSLEEKNIILDNIEIPGDGEELLDEEPEVANRIRKFKNAPKVKL